jgi:hypothetical protein
MEKKMEARAVHRLGSAQTFRHVSEHFRNSEQSKTFRRSEACGRQITAWSEEFSMFFLQWFELYWFIIETSKLPTTEEQLIETVRRYSSLYDPADKYYRDILRKDNA